MYGWGRNDYGQLGIGSKDDVKEVHEPTRIKSLHDKIIVMT